MVKSIPKSTGGATLKLLEQRVRARTQDLQNANRAAQNVLEDLQIEKEKLAVAKARNEALLGSIGEGVIATDERGIIVFVNRAAERSLHIQNRELVGRMMSEAVAMEDEKGLPILVHARPVALALTLGVATTSAAADPSYYYVRKNKTKFPIALTVTPVILDEKVIGAIEVFRDVTNEREIDRAKTEFVSLASHQLRTPLSTVRWYSDMLLGGDVGVVNAKQRQYLKEIQYANSRMIGLVNVLLHVSKLELGMVQVKMERVRLSNVVAEVLQDMELLRHTHKVSVEVQLPQTLPYLMTDIKLVRIVIENLLSNAIKYTPAHGMVRLVARRVSAGKRFYTHTAKERSIGISVRDTGIGIPKESQGKIFQKLFRAGNAQKIHTEGAGIGLYLARLVLGYLKGKIWFTSSEGKGTSFYVLLPCVVSRPDRKHRSTQLV